jgi:hypothetical protein
VPINNEIGWLPVNKKTVLGLLRKGVPHPDMKIMPSIAINEAGVADRKPVIAPPLHFCKCHDCPSSEFLGQGAV